MPNNQYPKGQISPHDEGQITFTSGIDRVSKKIIVDFGKPVKWLGFDAAEARQMAAMLNSLADQQEELLGQTT